MEHAAIADRTQSEQDRRISEIVANEQSRVRSFIRGLVADQIEVEDILQDVFYELVVAHRLMKPIEQAGAWLMRVARNRITDRFRKKKPEALSGLQLTANDGRLMSLEDLLPSPEAGPDAVYARSVLIGELEDALAELSPVQRQIFLAHEVEGLSFKEISVQTGLNINTLLSRKHSAVLYLRQRLRTIYEESINK